MELGWTAPGCGSLSEGDIEAELMEFFGEASGKAVFVDSLEMVCSEVLVGETSVEHDVDGGEHGCGHRDDGLLGATAGSEPEEQRLRIAGLDPHGRPGGLDEQGLEPGSAVTEASRAALARTLVILGGTGRPRRPGGPG